MKVRAIAAAALTAALAACSAASPTTATVQVGDALTFSVEVADTEQTQRDGLSGRTSLSEGTGMLFPFEERQEQQVWMAGMEISIDVAWIVDDQVLATDTLDPALRDLLPRTGRHGSTFVRTSNCTSECAS